MPSKLNVNQCPVRVPCVVAKPRKMQKREVKSYNSLRAVNTLCHFNKDAIFSPTVSADCGF
jgi:hypothetical protein